MNRLRSLVRLLFAVAVLAVAAVPDAAACACGCGVFDVGTSALLPTHPGGFAYLEFDHLDQRRNWHDAKAAPTADNDDRRIRTEMFTAGVQYMRDRAWGVMVDVPVWARLVSMVDMNGEMGGFDHAGIGDVRVRGIYAGFSEDMSTGLTFGAKLPTGAFRDPDFERDAQIGTGGTDLLLGAYHVGLLPGAAAWKWFANLQWDEPVLNAAGYRPGADVNAALGGYYDGWSVGGAKVAPVATAIGSVHWRDLGPRARPSDSGYKRVVLAPGLEVSRGRVRVYGDAGFPVYERVNGNQLVADVLYKLNVGWSF
ncbi:MAG: hypothetical protein HY079_10535 [Elusimicrobia bacterium]|nr:hypothetical protein [Elusimicrobiota bacterium]